MTHYRMLDKDPTVIICVNGDERKIYNNNEIFLNNEENFEMRFFNPENFKIGVEIIFNGQKKNEGLLVLRPGEDITLDRFLGDKKKMKYEIYTIDANNEAAVKAAALNGIVEFNFYKEATPNYFRNNFVNYNNTYTSPGIYCQDMDCSYTSNVSIGSHAGLPHFGNSKSLNLKSMKTRGVTSSMETGRIEKGPESTQNLKVVDVDFQTSPYHKIIYQLKPNSQKPLDIQEIRAYCPNCAYRIRKASWKYCPKCAEKLD